MTTAPAAVSSAFANSRPNQSVAGRSGRFKSNGRGVVVAPRVKERKSA